MFAAIDIDGTVSRHPAVLDIIANAKLESSVFLTGHSNENPATADKTQLLAGRIQQLAALGITTHLPIIICVGRNSTEVAEQKGIFCRDNKVELFIDDSINYCEAVRRLSPNTAIFHVFP